MIRLTKGTSTTIALTLSELANQSVANNWLFRFLNIQSDTYEYLSFLVADLDSPRYNEFTITLPADFDFRFCGDYVYEVYQMPDTDDEDYSRGTLVENGLMELLEATVATPTYTPNTDTEIYDSSNI